MMLVEEEGQERCASHETELSRVSSFQDKVSVNKPDLRCVIGSSLFRLSFLSTSSRKNCGEQKLVDRDDKIGTRQALLSKKKDSSQIGMYLSPTSLSTHATVDVYALAPSKVYCTLYQTNQLDSAFRNLMCKRERTIRSCMWESKIMKTRRCWWWSKQLAGYSYD